jgi:hypothetical protein
MTSCRSFADLELLHPSSARAPTRRRIHTPTRLPYPRSTLNPFPEVFMNTAVLVSSPRVSTRKPMTVAMLLATIVVGLGAAFPGYALDLVAFTGITGPLTSALTQIAALGPGIKAWSASSASSSRSSRCPRCATSARPVLRRPRHLRRRGSGDRRRDHGRGDLKRWHRHPGDRYASRHLHPAASR